MLEFEEFRNTNEYMIRKEPKKIYLFSNLLIIIFICLIFIGTNLKYNKYDTYLATVVNNDYLNIVMVESAVKNLKDCELIIEKQNYDFKIIEINKNEMDNNYNIIFDVNFNGELRKDKYLVVKMKHKKTTIFKEIAKRIREELY